MYLAGISMRRVEDIAEALLEARVSLGMINNMIKEVYAEIEKWRNEELVNEYPTFSDNPVVLTMVYKSFSSLFLLM